MAASALMISRSWDTITKSSSAQQDLTTPTPRVFLQTQRRRPMLRNLRQLPSTTARPTVASRATQTVTTPTSSVRRPKSPASKLGLTRPSQQRRQKPLRHQRRALFSKVSQPHPKLDVKSATNPSLPNSSSLAYWMRLIPSRHNKMRSAS